MASPTIKALTLLIVLDMIWGLTFPLMKMAMTNTTPHLFMTVRFTTAAILVSIIWRNKILENINSTSLKKAVILSTTVFLAYYLQLVGLKYTTSAKSAFITSLYIIFTPILEISLKRKGIRPTTMISLAMSIMGLTLLTEITDLTNVNIGDLITIIVAFMAALQIILIEKYSKEIDSDYLTSMQIIITSLYSLAILSLTSLPIQTLLNEKVIAALLYTSIVATVIGIYIQTTYQKYLKATEAAIIYTLEPVFAYILSYILLGETLTLQQITGGTLLITANILISLQYLTK